MQKIDLHRDPDPDLDFYRDPRVGLIHPNSCSFSDRDRSSLKDVEIK